jgi:hypothetical protein
MPYSYGWLRQIFISFKELRIRKPSTQQKQSVGVVRKLLPSEVVARKESSAARFDKITHTGQVKAYSQNIYDL